MNDSMKASLRASLPAAATLAAQVVMGKALRDALFLERWPATSLPVALGSAAVAAALVALALGWALTRWEPRRVAPLAWSGSALLLIAEALWSSGGSRFAALIVYVHLSALSAGLASLFWIQMSEAFDPRSARRAFAWTGALGTVGALAASVATGWLSAGSNYMPLFAGVVALQLATAFASPAILPLRPHGRAADAAPEGAPAVFAGGFAVLARHTYLRQIAWLVVALSVGATLLDYAFKARVAVDFAPAQRVVVFANFYAITSALAFIGQIALTRLLLGGVGLARTVATLPAAMTIAAAAAVAFPGAAMTAFARGVEAVLRGSVYRAGYELLFTPLANADRRSTKTVLDVGADRAGDGIGAMVLALVLALAGAGVERPIFAIAAIVSAAAAVLAVRLHRGYVTALEHGLARGTVQLNEEEAADRTTRETMMTLGGTRGLDAAVIRAELARRTGPSAAREADLDSGELVRVRAALAAGPITPDIAAHVIPLLASDEVAADALHALRGSAAELLPAFDAALRDPASPLAVRRRLPRAIASCDAPGAWSTLLAGLADARFDVRLQCALALDRWQSLHPGHRPDPEQLFDAVVRELARDREVWAARRRIATGHPTLFDQAIRQRSDRSFALVFTLLAMALPPEPVRLAHRGLLSADPGLRGTALEYLESVLPARVRDGLWPYLEERPGTRRPVSQEQALERLMSANPSVAIPLRDLAALRAEHDPDAPA
ncbi:MAG: hypothetical protein ABIS67_11485 [Candidatus Eisenbacteria bacterium]